MELTKLRLEFDSILGYKNRGFNDALWGWVKRNASKIIKASGIFISEKDRFAFGQLIGGDEAYVSEDEQKAVTINDYGEYYRIRIYNKINNHWVRIDENLNQTGEYKMEREPVSEPKDKPEINFYVYVTEFCKEDSPYPNNEREAIHEIGLSNDLPLELIFGAVEQEIKSTYDNELKVNPVIVGFKITKVLLALDKYLG